MKHGLFAPAAATLAALLAAPAVSQTVFVNEDFESYANQSAFETAWTPTDGPGLVSVPTSGTLVDQASGVAGQTGNAITGGAGNVNESADGFQFLNGGVVNSGGFNLVPSPTENIVVRGDIFIDTATGSTHRQTIGLRGDVWTRDSPGSGFFGTNILEMGTWNGDVCIPTAGAVVETPGVCDIPDPDAEPPIPGSPEAREETDLAFRIILFDGSTLGDYIENGVNQGAMQVSPNWQYFPLDPGLDTIPDTAPLPNGTFGNNDGSANLTDIGDGWHTFQAVISEDDVTLTLDLFRDGIDNVTGLPGVDSEVVVEVSMVQNFDAPPFDFDPAPMNSLRIGSPSGVSSDSGVASFDNIYLALEDANVGPAPLVGDYNDDGVVDAADYTVYRDALAGVPGVTLANETDNIGVVDGGDYAAWVNNFGATASAAGVPEPTALALASLTVVALGARRRG